MRTLLMVGLLVFPVAALAQGQQKAPKPKTQNPRKSARR